MHGYRHHGLGGGGGGKYPDQGGHNAQKALQKLLKNMCRFQCNLVCNGPVIFVLLTYESVLTLTQFYAKVNQKMVAIGPGKLTFYTPVDMAISLASICLSVRRQKHVRSITLIPFQII